MTPRSNKIHLWDARRIKELLSKESVKVTITSPPYFDLKDYGNSRQIGFGQTYDQYLQDLEQVFSGVHWCTKRNGALWIIVDTFKKSGSVVPFPFDLIRMLTKPSIGWILRDIVIWQKDKTLPWSRMGQLRKIFEYVLFFTKSSIFDFHLDRVKITDKKQFKEWWLRFPERYSPNGIAPTNIWRFPIPVQGSWSQNGLRHFNPLPAELAERIVLLSTRANDLVLDPFAGSGITLAVARRFKRRFVGLEINRKYIRMFEKKVLPEMGRKALSTKGGKSNNENTYLRTTLRKMRLVKYPKALIRKLISSQTLSESDLNLNTVFLLSQSHARKTPTRQSRMRPKILFVRDADSSIKRDEVYKAILDVSSRPPLSKYGIVPQVEVLTRSRLRYTRRLPMREYYLYSRGVVHKYADIISRDRWKTISGEASWKAHLKNGVPPIMSDIAVNQPR